MLHTDAEHNNTSISHHVMHIQQFSVCNQTTTSELVIWVQSMHQSLFCFVGTGNQCEIQSTEPIVADLRNDHSFLSWHLSVATSIYPELTTITPTLSTYREPLMQPIALTHTEGVSDDGLCDPPNSKSAENMQFTTTSTTILIPCQTVTVIYSGIMEEHQHYYKALVLANEMLIIPPGCFATVRNEKNVIKAQYIYVICLTFDGGVENADRRKMRLRNGDINDSMNGTRLTVYNFTNLLCLTNTIMFSHCFAISRARSCKCESGGARYHAGQICW